MCEANTQKKMRARIWCGRGAVFSFLYHSAPHRTKCALWLVKCAAGDDEKNCKLCFGSVIVRAILIKKKNENDY